MPSETQGKSPASWFLSQDRITTSVSLVFLLIVLQRLLQMVRVVVFARVLGPEHYGIYTLGMFLIPLLATVASLGLQAAFARYISRYQAQGTLGWFLKRTYYLTVVISGVMAAALLVAPGVFSRLLYGDSGQTSAIVVVALSVPAYLLIRNLATTFMGLKFFRAGSFPEFFQALVYAVCGIPLILILRSALGGLLGFALATYASVGLFGALLISYLRRVEPERRPGTGQNFYKNLLKFSLWFVVTPVLAQFFHYIDRLSLQHLRGTFDQGVYSATVSIAETVSAFGLAISSVIYPHISSTWEAGDKERAIRNLDLSIRVTSIVLLIVGLLLVLFGKWFVLLLLGGKYVPGVQALPFLVVYYVFTIVVWLFGVYPTLIEKTYIAAVGLVIALPASILLNHLLIPPLGMAGAGVATMLSYFLMLVVIAAVCARFGLRLARRTMVVCLLPFLLLVPNLLTALLGRFAPSLAAGGPAGLLPDLAGVLGVGAVLYASTRRTWILSRQERDIAYGEIGRAIGRARRLLSRRPAAGGA